MAKGLDLRVTLSAINKATGPLRQILEGSRGAGRAIRETRDQLRDLNTQQRRITAFRDMSRQSHDTRRALMDKREELRQISRQLETTEGPTRRLTQQQESAQREIDKLTREYRQQRDSVRDLARELPPGIEGARGLTEQNDALARQIEETNRRLDAQRDALGRLGRADVGGKFRNMTGEIRKFTRNVTLAGGLAAGTVFGLANSTATLGDDVAKTADLMGVGTHELQEMRYAAERAGLSTDTLDGSMQRMVRRTGRAAQGGGAAAKAYEELGINARELADMSPSQALDVVADRLHDIDNQTDRIAYASAIWGNNGEAMLNMIQGGSDALGDYYAQARSIGHVLGDGAVRDAEDFQDALLDNQLTMRGMRHTIGAELMPSVTDLMRTMTGWMQENRHQVQEFARDLGEGLKAAVPIVQDLVVGGWRLARAIGAGIDRVADMVGGYDNLAMVVGTLFASKMILSVISFGIALVKAGAALVAFAKTLPALAGGFKVLSAAFAATPIGWLIAGITALVYAGYLLWKNWGDLGNQFRNIGTQLRDAWSEGLGAVTRLILDWTPLNALYRVIIGALETLGVDIPDEFRTFGGFIVDGLIGGILGGIQSAIDAVKDLGRSIADGFRNMLDINSPSKVFEGFGTNIVEGIIGGIGGMAGALKDHVVGLAGDIASWMSDAVGNAWESGKDIASGLGQGIRNGASNVASRAGDLANETIGVMRGLFKTNSPSRVFRDIGMDVTAGLSQGIQRTQNQPIGQASGMAKQVRDLAGGLMLGSAAVASPAAANLSIDSRPPMAAQAAGGMSISIGDIHVHAAPGMDEQAVAHYVAAEVQRLFEQRLRDEQAKRRSAFYDID
nr:hypothetical protein [Halomonas socia]